MDLEIPESEWRGCAHSGGGPLKAYGEILLTLKNPTDSVFDAKIGSCQ